MNCCDREWQPSLTHFFTFTGVCGPSNIACWCSNFSRPPQDDLQVSTLFEAVPGALPSMWLGMHVFSISGRAHTPREGVLPPTPGLSLQLFWRLSLVFFIQMPVSCSTSCCRPQAGFIHHTLKNNPYAGRHFLPRPSSFTFLSSSWEQKRWIRLFTPRISQKTFLHFRETVLFLPSCCTRTFPTKYGDDIQAPLFTVKSTQAQV